MPRMAARQDGDGTPETKLVLLIEDELAGRDPAWLVNEHGRLESRRQSERGIGRKGWMRLQAVRYLIRRRKLKAELRRIHE